jgi:hypothetical protein
VIPLATETDQATGGLTGQCLPCQGSTKQLGNDRSQSCHSHASQEAQPILYVNLWRTVRLTVIRQSLSLGPGFPRLTAGKARRLRQSPTPGKAGTKRLRGLQICPATRDRDAALNWVRDYADAQVGIEGLVIKGLADRYHPGRRRWLKYRIRSSIEVIVGAVTGTLTAPNDSSSACPTPTTNSPSSPPPGPLRPAQQRQIAPFLAAPVEMSIPGRTASRPARRLGAWASGTRHVPVTCVQPTLVVEVEADTTHDAGRFPHLVRYTAFGPTSYPQRSHPL